MKELLMLLLRHMVYVNDYDRQSADVSYYIYNKFLDLYNNNLLEYPINILFKWINEFYIDYTDFPYYEHFKAYFSEQPVYPQLQEFIAGIKDQQLLSLSAVKYKFDEFLSEVKRRHIQNILTYNLDSLSKGGNVNEIEIIGAFRRFETVKRGVQFGEIDETYLSRLQVRSENVYCGNGYLSGLNEIDTNVRGAFPGDLIIIAGFTGHGKTLFLLNWCYYTRIFQSSNVVYFSLEMTLEEIYNALLARHSYALFPNNPISYEEWDTGNVMKNRLMDATKVITDWSSHKYGRFLVYAPDAVLQTSAVKNFSEIESLVHYLSAYIPIDIVVVDHVELLSPEGHYSDRTQAVNDIYRRARNFSLSVNGRRGKICLFLAHQINRRGYEEAKRNKGTYSLTALSYANEAERSACAVYTVFADQEEKFNNEAIVSCLKNRNRPFFNSFKVFVDPAFRYVGNLTEGVSLEV